MLCTKKYQKLTVEKILEPAGLESSKSDEAETIAQKYSETERSEKLWILIVLPKRWSITKIQASVKIKTCYGSKEACSG